VACPAPPELIRADANTNTSGAGRNPPGAAALRPTLPNQRLDDLDADSRDTLTEPSRLDRYLLAHQDGATYMAATTSITQLRYFLAGIDNTFELVDATAHRRARRGNHPAMAGTR
jgi:hypothetical protein